MANIGSDTSRRKKEPLAGFLAPENLLDAYFAGNGTRTKNTPEQNSGICQNRFPAAGSGTVPVPLRILVGFSGGADSTALLDRLSRLPGYSVAAVHVNHGIRGEEAIRDREFCRGFCRDRGIPFFCLDADVPAMRRQGESLETAARRVRYGYFAAVMGEQDYPLLAVAHNADDNLETVLFRICRGTGLRGLCGIPPVRAFGSGYLVRPLLGVSREEILRYLGERELSYVTDSTNEETDAARNRLRLTVIPALRAATGDPVAGVTRMTRLLAADSRYLEAEATRLFSAGNGAQNSDSGHGRNGDAGIPGTPFSPRPAAAGGAGEPGVTSNSMPKHDGDGFPSCKETACRNSEGYFASSAVRTGGSPAEPQAHRFQSTAGFPASEQSASPLRLSRAALGGAPDPLASRAIARLMEAAGGDPSAVHVEALLVFLRSGTAHGTFPVPGNKNAAISVTYDDISVTAAPAAKKTATAQSGAANPVAGFTSGSSVFTAENKVPTQGTAAKENARMPVATTTGKSTANSPVLGKSAPAQSAAEISGAEGVPASGRTSGHAGQPDTAQKNSAIPPVGASDDAPDEPPFAEAVRIRDGETCRFGRFTVERKTVPFSAFSDSVRSDLQKAAGSEVHLPSRSTPQAETPAKSVKNSVRNAPKIYNSLLRCAVHTDKINKEVFLRVRQPGDRILTCGMHKEVRRLFSDARIPPGERDSYPLLCDGNGILAIPGIAVRDGARIRPRSYVQNGEFPRGNCVIRDGSRVSSEADACGNCGVRNASVAGDSRGENPSVPCGTVTVFTFTSGLPGTLPGEGSESDNL